ncbi:MAG: ribbon-helix-helix protein, CopG family [Myxococcales bacterium]|nr:ribbon-helix-helix protein, CopG family [Myxococcales bacterium]
MYREVLGRETRSSDSAYPVWKPRQAQNGRIRAGPIERRAPGAAATVKVLPLRMTAAEVDALDEAWRRLGFRSRTAMIRAVIATYVADRNALLPDQALAPR